MIPEINKEYYFFDDGKISPSRCFKAKVVNIIPYENANEIMINIYNCYGDFVIPTCLTDIHNKTVNEHRQKKGFIVINSHTPSIKEGEPYLYAEKTDYFIECNIPGYDENNIWFVRTIDNEWFSINIQNDWQSGYLDVENKRYNQAKEMFGDEYDNELKIYKQYIE